MKLVIVASGAATRLYPITKHVPKLLVNTGKNTGLIEIIKAWTAYNLFSEIIVIVNSKDKALISAYWNLYYPDIKLTILTCDTQYGTAHTIAETLDTKYDGQEILFTWSDIYPSKPIDFGNFEDTIFLQKNGKNRYNFDGENISLVPDQTGNVIGMYFIKKYKKFQYEIGQDFVDCIFQLAPYLQSFEIEVKDFGEMDKLRNLHTESDNAREFNSLTITETSVEKKALNDQGLKLISTEGNWYQKVDDCIGIHNLNVPKIISTTDESIVMEKLNAKSIHWVFDNLPFDQQVKVLKSAKHTLQKLHSYQIDIDKETLLNDVLNESSNKLKTRCKEIEHVIKAFGPINKVNGLEIKDLDYYIDNLGSFMKTYYTVIDKTDKYSLIHGDPQFSNLMIDDNLDIWVIDPRGYFGSTKFFGLPDYDYAKILYSFSGYDKFNLSPDYAITSLQDGHLQFNIDKFNCPLIDLSKEFTEIQYAWLCVIWIGLAQYIKCNPIKSLVALYHGMYLSEKFFAGEKTI